MDCRESRTWLHAYLDGELDLSRTVEIERHLEGCPACAQAHDSQRTLQDSIQAADLEYNCPEQLRAGIQSKLSRETIVAHVRPRNSPRWLAIAASLFVAVGVCWFAVRSLPSQSTNDRIADEVVANHVRSLLASHLTDVASSDRHTVKPWFAGKLDFAPTVADYSSAGFPLTGGRLDYLEHRPVAALVYHRRQHAINVFIWPTADANSAPQSMASQGYHLVHWIDAGAAYWVISDLNRNELNEFVELVRNTER